MKAKKIAALLLASSMALSLVACGGKQATQTDSTSATEAEETAAAEDAAKEEPAEEAASEVSIDFEDGVFGFVGNDKTVNSAAGDSTFSVEDYNGGKALKITSSGKAIYAGIQADALLGDKASELKTVEMTVGTENPDGTFYSTAGNIYGFTGEKNNKSNTAWSVYLETANPKTISYTVPDGETAPSLNGPDENGNYSFSMPDYDITLTAKWTQKDVIDPDVDLKFDAATGEVTSNNTQVNADDIINRKFYDDKGNEVPGEKLNNRGLPTEPGDYIVKVDVKETENTAPANQVTGNQIKWSYSVPQKEEKVTYTLSLLGGIAKVNGKDATINDNGDITIEKGATVEVTFDKSILSDAQTFDQWTIKPASVLSAVEPKAETITFTMPGENVIIEAMTKDASIEEEPNILGTTLIIGTAAAGTAVLAYQTYQLGTEFYLICALPTGTAIPTNRGELAALVWNNAGKPEPAAVLNANATETDKAIAWAVENDLLKAAKSNGETYEATDPVSRTEVIKAWNQVQAFKK